MRRVAVCTGIVLALLAGPARLPAQNAAPCPPPPALFVRLSGPPGMKVTIYRGGPVGEMLNTPCVVGFRPGYRYRIELGDLPAQLRPTAASVPPGVQAAPLTVIPSLDVIGSLRPLPSVHPWSQPASIVFTEDDFNTVRAGSVVTKVVVLERPETAVPVATTCDTPFELTVPPNLDPMQEAQKHGRPLLVLHMGDGQASPQELACQGIPGTVLLQGDAVLPPPRDPPWLPWMCWPVVDPRAGLPCPQEEICFHDGGDGGLPVGLRPDGKLVGLDPADTVAQYVDNCGNPKIAVSNKVCLCVPRYLLIRTAIAPASNTTSTQPGDTRVSQAPAKWQLETGPIEYQQNINLATVSTWQKPSGLVNLQQTQVVGRSEGLVIYANAEGVGHVTGMCAPPEAAECAKLVIFKWPDKCELQIGDLVTFFIRYKNQGSRPITGVAVSDSLTARLEYVPQSARSDRDAMFTTTPNEAGSAVLRWEITGTLPGGETGTVCFQARVR
jgi:uncharacterized repeat protein (TIGR01451 family)